MPFTRLIELLREAMISLRKQAAALEAKFGREITHPPRPVCLQYHERDRPYGNPDSLRRS